MEQLKLIIAGSRNFQNYQGLNGYTTEFLEKLGFTIRDDITVISGTASGADRLGEVWAKANGLNLLRMPADWKTHGKSAGYRRNVEMAEVADACIVFWDGKSRGSKHMIDIAKKKGLPLRVVNFNG